jgi:hypothetical protein
MQRRYENTMRHTLKVIVLALLATALCFGADALNATTLSAAITTPTQSTISLTSATYVTAQGPDARFNTVVYVDRELIGIKALVSGTTYTVQRGMNGTRPFVHTTLSPVYYGSPVGNFITGTGTAAEMFGACLSTNEVTLPKIYTNTGNIYDCKRTSTAGTAGQWILIRNGTFSPQGLRATAFCTGTAGSAETEYLNGAACSSATSATAGYLVTAPGTLANLYSNAGTAVAGGSGKDVVTVYVNGSATTITCTYATGGAATTCSDTTHSAPVVAGDVITFQFISATSDTAANVRATVGIY